MSRLFLLALSLAILAPDTSSAQSATFDLFDADFRPTGVSGDGATIVGNVRSGSSETGFVEVAAVWREGAVTVLDVPANV